MCVYFKESLALPPVKAVVLVCQFAIVLWSKILLASEVNCPEVFVKKLVEGNQGEEVFSLPSS